MKETLAVESRIISYSRSVQAEYFKDSQTLIITAKSGFITEEEFKGTFNELEVFIRKNKVDKLIFDMRRLSVFHLPSMEWYYMEWKPKVAAFGLKKHYKLLPDNEIFRMRVEIGRKKLFRKYAENLLFGIDVKYLESIEEALLLK
jgi:hypothetical protein